MLRQPMSARPIWGHALVRTKEVRQDDTHGDILHQFLVSSLQACRTRDNREPEIPFTQGSGEGLSMLRMGVETREGKVVNDKAEFPPGRIRRHGMH